MKDLAAALVFLAFSLGCAGGGEAIGLVAPSPAWEHEQQNTRLVLVSTDQLAELEFWCAGPLSLQLAALRPSQADSAGYLLEGPVQASSGPRSHSTQAENMEGSTVLYGLAEFVREGGDSLSLSGTSPSGEPVEYRFTITGAPEAFGQLECM